MQAAPAGLSHVASGTGDRPDGLPRRSSAGKTRVRYCAPNDRSVGAPASATSSFTSCVGRAFKWRARSIAHTFRPGRGFVAPPPMSRVAEDRLPRALLRAVHVEVSQMEKARRWCLPHCTTKGICLRHQPRPVPSSPHESPRSSAVRWLAGGPHLAPRARAPLITIGAQRRPRRMCSLRHVRPPNSVPRRPTRGAFSAVYRPRPLAAPSIAWRTRRR